MGFGISSKYLRHLLRTWRKTARKKKKAIDVDCVFPRIAADPTPVATTVTNYKHNLSGNEIRHPRDRSGKSRAYLVHSISNQPVLVPSNIYIGSGIFFPLAISVNRIARHFFLYASLLRKEKEHNQYVGEEEPTTTTCLHDSACGEDLMGGNRIAPCPY